MALSALRMVSCERTHGRIRLPAQATKASVEAGAFGGRDDFECRDDPAGERSPSGRGCSSWPHQFGGCKGTFLASGGNIRKSSPHSTRTKRQPIKPSVQNSNETKTKSLLICVPHGRLAVFRLGLCHAMLDVLNKHFQNLPQPYQDNRASSRPHSSWPICSSPCRRR